MNTNNYSVTKKVQDLPIILYSALLAYQTLSTGLHLVLSPMLRTQQCGACWAFSSTGSIEGINFITNGKLISLSEQQLVDCSHAEGNLGCHGGLMDDAFEYAAEYPLESEADYPYLAKGGSC